MATVKRRIWTNKAGEHAAWVVAFTDGNGVRHKTQFPTKREADTYRVEVEGKVNSGTFRQKAEKVTVADACRDYLASLTARHERDARVTTTYLATVRAEIWNYIAQEIRPSDHATRTKAGGVVVNVRNRSTPFSEGVGRITLAKLSASAVGDFRDRLLSTGISVSTVRRVLATLSRVLQHAISRDHVAFNSAKAVKVVGSLRDGPKKIVPPTKAAMQKLLEAADPDFRVRLLFAASSGLRASEQWALRWRHLDLEAGTVTVETRLDIYGAEDTTKSAAGQRTIPLGKRVVAELKQWRGSNVLDDALVFPGKRGSYTRHGNMLKRRFDPLAASVGQSSLTWHGLRHYAVSTWIEAGLLPKDIQTFAGHASLAITMDRYGHLFPKEGHRKAMDAIADALLA